jgi:hypothetical protein
MSRPSLRTAQRASAVLALGAAVFGGGLITTASPASASGVYVCYQYSPINYPNGQPLTYYPFPDGVQGDRCSSASGGGAGTELPFGLT